MESAARDEGEGSVETDIAIDVVQQQKQQQQEQQQDADERADERADVEIGETLTTDTAEEGSLSSSKSSSLRLPPSKKICIQDENGKVYLVQIANRTISGIQEKGVGMVTRHCI